ncbi:MAG: VOC family protein [Myxococcota bacterium]|nr:VOC family protein [Myxococcota bacterium]
MSNTKLCAVFRRTTDPVALATWYAEQLFLQPAPRRLENDDQTGFTMDGVYFGFERNADVAIGNATVLWFSVDDAFAVADRLERAGARLVEAPNTVASPGETLVLLTDPEGNPLGLIGPEPGNSL